MHFRRRFEPGDDGIDPDKKKPVNLIGSRAH